MKPFNLFAVVALFTSLSNSAGAAEPSRRPLNLLFIITDQQRWDAMSCAGNKVIKTPNMDQLARDGAIHPLLFGLSGVRSRPHVHPHGTDH